jgi:enoyl-[acyl-carrier protein] reductase I
VLTYPSERLEENVRELAATLDNPLVLPCAVADDQQIANLSAALNREFGGLDFFLHGAAFAPADALKNPFTETSRESFRVALDVSAYSLIGLSRAVTPLMEKRGGGSILTLTFIGSDRVFTNYNVMGVANAALESSVRYLASDLGPKNIRVNAISAGAIKTLASAASRHSTMLQAYREKPAAPGRDGGSRGRRRFPAQPAGADHGEPMVDFRPSTPWAGLTPYHSSIFIRSGGMPRSARIFGISSTSAGGPQMKQSVAGSWTSSSSASRFRRPRGPVQSASVARVTV